MHSLHWESWVGDISKWKMEYWLQSQVSWLIGLGLCYKSGWSKKHFWWKSIHKWSATFVLECHLEVCIVVCDEAKIPAGVMIVQDMLYIYWLLKSIEFNKVMPMLLEMDNGGAVRHCKQLVHWSPNMSPGHQKEYSMWAKGPRVGQDNACPWGH